MIPALDEKLLQKKIVEYFEIDTDVFAEARKRLNNYLNAEI